MQIIFDKDDVTLQDVAPTPIAIIGHRGDRAGLPETFRRFRAWGETVGLPPEARHTYMVFRSEREPVDPADYSMDLCAATDQPIESNDLGVVGGLIPGGRCAVLRYPGNTNNLEPAALYLYRDWLPASGEEARDFPIYSRRRLALIPHTQAHEVVVELFLPIK